MISKEQIALMEKQIAQTRAATELALHATVRVMYRKRSEPIAIAQQTGLTVSKVKDILGLPL